MDSCLTPVDDCLAYLSQLSQLCNQDSIPPFTKHILSAAEKCLEHQPSLSQIRSHPYWWTWTAIGIAKGHLQRRILDALRDAGVVEACTPLIISMLHGRIPCDLSDPAFPGVVAWALQNHPTVASIMLAWLRGGTGLHAVRSSPIHAESWKADMHMATLLETVLEGDPCKLLSTCSKDQLPTVLSVLVQPFVPAIFQGIVAGRAVHDSVGFRSEEIQSAQHAQHACEGAVPALLSSSVQRWVMLML